jgi:hypothetical protein
LDEMMAILKKHVDAVDHAAEWKRRLTVRNNRLNMGDMTSSSSRHTAASAIERPADKVLLDTVEDGMSDCEMTKRSFIFITHFGAYGLILFCSSYYPESAHARVTCCNCF